jgi:hypothetical protein
MRKIWGNAITPVGYSAGAGGTVTQITNKSTGVTLDKMCGTITLHNAELAAAAIVSFTVTNAQVAATDLVLIQHDSVATLGKYLVSANTMAAGSFNVTVTNISAGNLSEAIVLRFAIVRAVIT